MVCPKLMPSVFWPRIETERFGLPKQARSAFFGQGGSKLCGVWIVNPPAWLQRERAVFGFAPGSISSNSLKVETRRILDRLRKNLPASARNRMFYWKITRAQFG